MMTDFRSEPSSRLGLTMTFTLGIIVCLLHGGLFYNTVALQNILAADDSLQGITDAYPHVVTNGTAYFLIGDIVGGSVLNPLMDQFGPRKFAMAGHVVNIISYSMLAFGPRQHFHQWFVPVMFLLGCGLQMNVNPTMLLGKKFGAKHSGLVLILLGASAELGLPLTTVWAWTGTSLASGALMLLLLTCFTGIFVTTTYGDTYQDFSPGNMRDDLPLPRHGSLTPRGFAACESDEEAVQRISATKTQGFKEIISSRAYLRNALSYAMLFIIFQCQTTYWTASTADYPVLRKVFYFGSFCSIVFGVCAGFIASKTTALSVAKYYYLASIVVCLALAWDGVIGLSLATIVYFTYKSCIFTVWFALINESFPCDHIGSLFAIPQFASCAVFWTINLLHGQTMDGLPNTITRITWAILALTMLAGYSISATLQASHHHHHHWMEPISIDQKTKRVKPSIESTDQLGLTDALLGHLTSNEMSTALSSNTILPDHVETPAALTA